MTFEVRREIAADHPSLPGHFPNAPLVAGVLILDEVFAALHNRYKTCRLASIRAVKFLQPLRPGQPFTVFFAGCEDDVCEVKFCCRIEDRVIAEGRLEVCWGTRATS